jgi:hypothetical protein
LRIFFQTGLNLTPEDDNDPNPVAIGAIGRSIAPTRSSSTKASMRSVSVSAGSTGVGAPRWRDRPSTHLRPKGSTNERYASFGLWRPARLLRHLRGELLFQICNFAQLLLNYRMTVPIFFPEPRKFLFCARKLRCQVR